MPLVLLDGFCPGVNTHTCTFSTDVQNWPCATAGDEVCSVCAAVHGLPFGKLALSYQLSRLLCLDHDVFLQAKRQLPPETARDATKKALEAIRQGLPQLRGVKRKHQTEALTRASYVLCRSRFTALDQEVKIDDASIVAVELTFRKRMPPAIRLLVCNFLAPTLSDEYRRLCKIKTNGFDALERPIFWPRLDSQSLDDVDSDEEEPPDPMMLREIHGAVVASRQKRAEQLCLRMRRANKVAKTVGFSARIKWSQRCASILAKMARRTAPEEHPLSVIERELRKK